MPSVNISIYLKDDEYIKFIPKKKEFIQYIKSKILEKIQDE